MRTPRPEIGAGRSKANGDKAKVAGRTPTRDTSSLCNQTGGAVGADSTVIWTVHASIFATFASSAWHRT